MSIIRQKRYVCVACEQEVTSIGGYLSTDHPLPLIQAVRVCEPCSTRMNKSAGFRRAAKSRTMAYATREIFTHVAGQMGMSLAEFQSHSIKASAGLPPKMCELLDQLFQLPEGAHGEKQ
jgi:hypothetical protein